MHKTIALTIASLTLFAATAAAQDAPPAPPAPPVADEDAPEVDVHRQGVIVLQDDSDDAPRVIILEGDDLDGGVLLPGMDLDLDLDEHVGPKGTTRSAARIRLSDGETTFEWSSEDGEMPKDLKKRLKGLHLEHKGAMGFGGAKLFDPAKRGEFLETMRDRAKKAQAKRQRQATIDALKLDDEAASVIVPLLDKVLETQSRIQRDDARRRAELKTAPQDEAALRPKLDSLRSAAKLDAKTLSTVRGELRALLTLEQEIELVLRGVLD